VGFTLFTLSRIKAKSEVWCTINRLNLSSRAYVPGRSKTELLCVSQIYVLFIVTYNCSDASVFPFLFFRLQYLSYSNWLFSSFLPYAVLLASFPLHTCPFEDLLINFNLWLPCRGPVLDDAFNEFALPSWSCFILSLICFVRRITFEATYFCYVRIMPELEIMIFLINKYYKGKGFFYFSSL
jgi:hypothetical protein